MHSCISMSIMNPSERNEVEAEARVHRGSSFRVDTSGSAFYLAAWETRIREVIQERLGRISSTAQEIIEALEINPTQMTEYRVCWLNQGSISDKTVSTGSTSILEDILLSSRRQLSTIVILFNYTL